MMVPIQISVDRDEQGHGIRLTVSSPEKSLHISEYLNIIEGWLTATKKQYQAEIQAFSDLKNSGKLVSMSEWKRGK